MIARPPKRPAIMLSFAEHITSHGSVLSFREALLLDVLCALIVHKIYNKYEINPINVSITALLLIVVPALPVYFLAAHMMSTVLSVLLSYTVFYGSLTLSIVLYRISPIHPLAGYPGPLSLKISKFVGMYYAAGGKQYTFFRRLHEKYGPYVRVGPNELSVADVEAIQPVFGDMRKGPIWIEHGLPGLPPHILALRDVKLHRERRNLWKHGFSMAALKDLQPAVENRVLELVEALGERTSPKSGWNERPLDLAQWLANFTYDFMGDLVFGGGLNLMRSGDEGSIREVLEGHVKIVGIMQHIPWVRELANKLVADSESLRKYPEFVIQRYEIRKQQEATNRDLFHYITNEEGLEKIEVPREQALNEIAVAIGAGADTSSSVLAGLFFHLLSNTAVLAKLQNEVDAEFPAGEGDPFDAAKLSGMPYLNAVINEALRLQPALPTSLQRTPLEGSNGQLVAGRFMPESTAINIPPYVLHRDPRYFAPVPDSFIPERWLDTDSTKFTTTRAAFIPFAAGPANCLGKNLALLEMRMVVAAIIQRFNIRFADGYDPGNWEKDLQDFMVTKVGKLPVVLEARG